MTLVEERPITHDRPSYLDIPAFSDTKLFDLDAPIPTPLTESRIEENGSVTLYFIGETQKGPIFIFRPKNIDDITVFLEHRSYHSPLVSNPTRIRPSLNDIKTISEYMRENQEEIEDMEEYERRRRYFMSKPHREIQEFIRDYSSMLSRIIDPSLETIWTPECYLEVPFDVEIDNGETVRTRLDFSVITHSGLIIPGEVASRRLGDDEKRREDKYIINQRNGNGVRKWLGLDDGVYELNAFYEDLGNNTLYLSLRYPQEVR